MMEAQEWHTRDKKDWPTGEWQSEPDKAQWTDEETGLPCLIVRNLGGALCGYVGVDSSHRLYGKEYSDYVDAPPDALDREVSQDRMAMFATMLYACREGKEDGKVPISLLLDVHGGVTFSGKCEPHDDPSTGICYAPEDGEPDDIWWFGFDCSHADDFSPAYASYFPAGMGGTYRDIGYVKAEIRGMAKQLAALNVPRRE